MNKIVILTGDELRHDFFRIFLSLSANIEVLKSYVEVPDKKIIDTITGHKLLELHLLGRAQVETDFFDLFCKNSIDCSKPTTIIKGEINSEKYINEIIQLNPDLIISYGCSIIKSSLIKIFQKRFINIHLGLSPYYRGSGTNFFPFVNNEPEYVGVTFMYIDEGIDTGEIIHQIRPLMNFSDNVHQIGNRLIKQMTEETLRIIEKFNCLQPLDQIEVDFNQKKYYRKKDFTEKNVEQMLDNFKNNMILDYLEEKVVRDNQVPILQNPSLV